MRIFASRHLILALVAVAAAATFLATRPGIAPAGAGPLTVNSTANTSDGTCDVASCTLREAIEDVNDGVSDLIEFDPDVFDEFDPPTINIEDGEGVLPAISSDVTIDLTGAGLVIDGDGNDDGTVVGPALSVTGTHNGFFFELFGEGELTIQDTTDAIDVDGQTFSADSLTFDGLEITDITDDGIVIHDVPFASFITLTDSVIGAFDAGIAAIMTGPDMEDIDYYVSGNDIEAAMGDTGGPAVSLNMQTAMAASAAATVSVDDNQRIVGHGDNAVNIVYCSSGTPCALDHSQMFISVSGNGEVTGDSDAIHMRLNADPEDPPTSSGSSIELQMDDNGSITGQGDAIDVDSHICCDNNRQTVTVDGNGAISTLPGGDDAVDMELAACCAPGTGVTVDISDNTDGITAREGEAIQLRLPCCGNNSVDINDNQGDITSDDDSGIHISACVEDEVEPSEDEAECIGASNTVVTIAGNTLTGSHEDGIRICCGEFQRGTERSVIAGNVITGNERDGIQIDSSHGITVGPANVIMGNGVADDEDDNAIEISNMASAIIFASYAIEVPANGITVTRNQTSANGGLGIDLVGFSQTGDPNAPIEDDFEAADVGCHQFPGAQVNANDCLGSPIVTGVADDVASGTGCVGCQVEIFLANQEPQDQPLPPPLPEPGGVSAGTNPQNGEGATFLGAATVANDGTFSIELPCGLSAGLLTATQTNEEGSTSEFSENVAFSGTSSVDCTPTPTPGTPTTPQPTTPAPTTPSATTPSPTTPAATPTPTATFDQLPCGDVDGNLSINSIDAALVLQYSAGLIQTLTVPQRADVNEDGDINAIDAALILQHTAGLLDELDC
jgi:CSLREA domain-containing protein